MTSLLQIARTVASEIRANVAALAAVDTAPIDTLAVADYVARLERVIHEPVTVH